MFSIRFMIFPKELLAFTSALLAAGKDSLTDPLTELAWICLAFVPG